MTAHRVACVLWGAGVHARRAAPAALLGLGVVLIANLTLRPVEPRSAAKDAASERIEPWRVWRERLAKAHRARRDGDVLCALRLYDSVGRAGRARVADEHVARYWHARLRLEQGERSAVVALHSLVESCVDPLLVARIGATAARARSAATDAQTQRALMSIMDAARSVLRAMSRVQNDEGRRAEHWRDFFERTTAPVFF